MLEMALVLSMLATPTDGFVYREQKCLIENAIYEAANQGPKGMQLATEIAINRLDRNYRGAQNACAVIYAPAQFSWTLTPKEKRRAYTDAEYHAAAQVVFSVLYDEVDRILPGNVLHYLNKRDATDLSWYDPSKVVLSYRNHEFLALN